MVPKTSGCRGKVGRTGLLGTSVFALAVLLFVSWSILPLDTVASLVHKPPVTAFVTHIVTSVG